MGAEDYKYSNIEGIDADQIIATYYIETPISDLLEYANSLALEQSTGTWTDVPAGALEECKRRTAKTVFIYKLPYESERGTNVCIFRIAFPTENIPPDFSTLLASVSGNIMGLTGDGWATKLIDLEFPKEWLNNFKGPKFGREGVKNHLGIRDRPILNNMIKPCTGVSTETHVGLFKEAAFGGTDNVKDDELLTDPKYNPFYDRLSKCMEVVDKKEKEMGEKTMYSINVTDDVSKLLEKAEKAVEMGVNGLMVDSSVGLSGLRMLAEDPSINVPLMYHPEFAANIVGGPRSGMTLFVYSKLARIAGADIVFTGDYRGKFPGQTKHIIFRTLGVVTSPLRHIKPCMPFVTGGGVHPGHVSSFVRDYGKEIIIGAGGGIHGHPMGPRAGAIAFRQAIDAAIKNIPPMEAAKDHKELKVALDKWGIMETAEDAKRVYTLRQY